MMLESLAALDRPQVPDDAEMAVAHASEMAVLEVPHVVSMHWPAIPSILDRLESSHCGGHICRLTFLPRRPLVRARWRQRIRARVPLEPARLVVEPHHEVEIVNRVAAVTGLDKREVRRSDFERVFTTEYGKHAGTSLKRQYRMLPPIGRLVSEVFYRDLKLEPGRSDPEIEPSCLPPDLDRPLLWIDTDRLGDEGFERATSEGFSRINQAEANAIVALLERWLAHDKFSEWLSGQTKHDAGSPDYLAKVAFARLPPFEQALVEKAMQAPPKISLAETLRILGFGARSAVALTDAP
jgi:hypothetical protein